MSLSVSKIVNLSPAVLNSFTPELIDDESIKEYPTLGGILSNTDYGWLANGPNLEIISTNHGKRIGAWSFNLINNAEVICVEQIQKIDKRPPLLAVALDCGDHGSMICIFNFTTSKVIRAIEVQETITSLHVIDSGNDIFTLPSPLRAFDGILAIGTTGGPVYLIDICRQICDDGLTLNGLVDVRDELNPCQLFTITLEDIDKIELHKESAIRHNHHLAIYLNATLDNKTQHFLLKGPKGEHRTYVDAKEALVSALYYCSQLGSLLVGYNFGAFQVYNLVDLTLIYTSPICEEHLPITHFTIQEPVDDPRAYCYIWAVYSAGRDFQPSFPLAVMYAFCYHTKEYHEGYGFLYHDFNYASIQFQMDLNWCSEGGNRRNKPQGGRCLRLNTIQRCNFLRGDTTPPNDSTDDNLSLSVFVWNVIYDKRDSDTCVCIFDLNQWYKEQLPNVPDSNFSSTYMIQFCISNLFSSSINQDHVTLDVNIIGKSLKQFKGVQKLEEYFCPNALSYDLCTLREDSVIFLQSKGVQKSLLAHIESSGPLCLIEPSEIYQQIIGLGLLPLFIDLPSNVPISTNQQREIILSTALEHQLRGWLCKCASEWASGNFLSAGCSLDFLLSWAFQRATILKTNCDNFCIPLFDYSQRKLDTNTANLLHNCIQKLRNLTNFYGFIIEKLYRFLSNPELIEEQYKSLKSNVVYFDVLKWLLYVGLLPECPISSYQQIDDFQHINVPYPVEMLIGSYNQRRHDLKIENEKKFASSNSPLFIDNLIDSEYGGELLQGHWRSDDGNGLYPPPSIQSLLRSYLIEDADILFKHTIVSYLLLDLAMILDQDRYKPVVTYLIKFPVIFKLSLSRIKIIQAFWQLDHGDCNTAIGLLLDSLVVRTDLNEWHHKIVLRLLILQDQHKLALLYLQVRKPFIKDMEDICAIISLYVSNDMLDEAFHFEKCYNGQSNKKLLLHLFDEAEKNGKLKSLIQRNFNQEQETLFLDYLAKSQKPYAKDLQIYYQILRSRYIEAFHLYNNRLSNHVESQGLIGQSSANPLDQLIHNLKRSFPEITQKILNFCQHNNNYVFENVPTPTPMSVFVYNSDENTKYKSNFIGAAIAKTLQLSNDIIDKRFSTETTPFIRNPIINKTSQRDSPIVIDSQVIKIDNTTINSIYESPPPNKRLKLSTSSIISLSTSKLETPIVKRKMRKTPETNDKTNVPQSILKKLTTTRQDVEDDYEKLNSTPLSSLKERKSTITPRKSLERRSPSVRFEGLKSRSFDDKQRKSSKSPTDDVFSSPDVSFENNEIEANSSQHDATEIIEEKISPVCSPKSRKSLPRRSSPRLSLRFNNRESSSSSILSTSFLENLNNSNESGNKKDSPNKSLEIDDNLRLNTENVNKTDSLKIENTSIIENVQQDESTKRSPKILPNLRPRKSLCRQVLENNTASRVLASPKRRFSQRIETEKCNQSTETIQETHIESSLKFNDGEKLQQSSLIEKHCVSTKTLIEKFDDDDDDDISLDISYLNETKTGSELDDSQKLYSTDILQETNENIPKTESNNPVSVIDETENQDSVLEKPESILNDNETIQQNEKTIEIVSNNETTFENKSEIINIDETHKESKSYNDDVMEVDDYDDIVDEKTTNNNDDDDVKLIYDDLSQSSQIKETNDNVDLSKDNETVNIYEISDDKDGVDVEEVILEEDNDFRLRLDCEDDETPILEQNVFSTDSSEDDNQEIDEQKQQVEEPEIIEIMSSSEEDKNNEDSDDVSSENSSLDVVYEKNINDSSSENNESTENSAITSDDHDDAENEVEEEEGGGNNEGETVCLFTQTIREEEEETEVASKNQDSPKEVDYKKRQSFGLFHGPIVELDETTIRVEEKIEKDAITEQLNEEQDSTKNEEAENDEEIRSVDATTHQQDETAKNSPTKLDIGESVDENLQKEIEEEEKDVSKKQGVADDQGIDDKGRQSYGLFHGNIIETTIPEENEETEKDFSTTLDISKIENKSIDDNKDIDYKRRQSYGLFHGSIIESNEIISEDKDCLTKLDISVIENKAVDEIKYQIIAEIGENENPPINVEKNTNIIKTDMIDLPSTSQINLENTEMIDMPSISGITNQTLNIGKRKLLRRRANSEDTKELTLRRSTRRRSASFHSEGHQDSFNNSDLNNTSILSKSLRSRTITLNESGDKSIRRQRKTSIDNDDTIKQQKKSVKRHAPITQLPEIIEEHDDDDDENRAKRIKETLENYSLSRRITRRQATLLQSIDPVVVLDKLPTDENLKQIEGEHESLLGSTSSQIQPKRRLRSNSQNSATSIQSDSKVSSITGRKIRSTSTDVPSDTSEKSVTTSKRNKKTKSESSDNSPEIERVTRTRSRTNSESSTASNVSITSRTRGKAKSSNLPKIKEEDSEEKTVPSKRVTRKKSSQK